MGYVVDIDSFHGPLDLLLYLLDKNQIDIYDIPIAKISDQFIYYIDRFETRDLEIIGEFLLMASYLLQLKSKMLLPQYQKGDQEQELYEEDPREELVTKLLVYKQIKIATEFLENSYKGEIERTFYRGGGLIQDEKVEFLVDYKSLFSAFQKVMESMPAARVESINFEKDIDISEKIQDLLRILQAHEKGISLREVLLLAETRREAIVIFLALLELVRLSKVKTSQECEFGPIIITRVVD